MPEMKFHSLILDPDDLDRTLNQLDKVYDLDAEALLYLRRIIGLFPHAVRMSVDEANAILYQDLTLADKFSFDIETDDLVIFSSDPETLIDALIEMAMYLAGFATLLGSSEGWVVEFAIGAWKPVKNRIKRELDMPVNNQPRLIVGMPPSPDQIPVNDPYPFRTLVSTYDLASFYQMVVLAARDDVAVYFPPETHHKVLAVYVYMRRAMQEISQNVGIEDHEIFNSRLVETVQRMEHLFDPATLPPPGPIRRTAHHPDEPGYRSPRQLGLFPDPDTVRPERGESQSTHYDPFEEFIEQLFWDDDSHTDPSDR